MQKVVADIRAQFEHFFLFFFSFFLSSILDSNGIP